MCLLKAVNNLILQVIKNNIERYIVNLNGPQKL